MRILAVVILLAATVVAPWWVAVLLIAGYIWLFRYFVEAVLVSWMVDAVFMIGVVPWITFAVLIYLLVVELIKNYILY